MFVVALLVAGGLALLIAKPKINTMFGYASKLSVKNERNWKFANTVFALTMLFVGALIAVETAVINLLKADIKVFMPVTMVTLAVGLFLMAWLLGACLKKHLKSPYGKTTHKSRRTKKGPAATKKPLHGRSQQV